jgi:uncharacterized protein YjbI with pentapeptide repeats
MATPEETRIDQLVTSVNDVAQLARALFFGLLLVALTVAAIVVGTTDDAILRNNIDVTPTLGVRLSVSLAHMFAPIILLFLHVNALIQLDLLGQRWIMLDQAIAVAGMNKLRKHHHARLHGFAVIQHLAEAKEANWTGRLLRVMTWLTVVGAPLIVLLALQVGFLRYQSTEITIVHKVAVVLDTLVLWWFLSRRRKREGAAQTPIVRPFWWQPVLRIVKWLLIILALILVVSYGLQTWLQGHLQASGQPTSETHSDIGDYGRLAMSTLGGLALVIFGLLVVALVVVLFQHPKRGWLLWVFAIVSVVIANPPRGQEANDVRWMETVTFSTWWKRDTLPRQEVGFFKEGWCSSRGTQIWGSKYVPFWTDVFVWPAMKLCNPLDIYVCPYVGWGCRYLQLANTTQIATATPPGVLKEIMASNQHVAAQLRIIGLRQRGRSFRYASLKDALLFGADLIGADLEQANLEEANLQGAWLDGANLKGAMLDDARLEDASFDGANLEGAALREAKMHRANFEKAGLRKASFNRVEMMGGWFDQAQLEDTNLKDADLRGVSFEGASLVPVIERNEKGEEKKITDLANSDLRGASFANAQLVDVSLNGADLDGVGLVGAKLSGTRIDGKQLFGATLTYAELAGVVVEGLTPNPPMKPSKERIDKEARVVAKYFTSLACKDKWIAKGIIHWVSDAYDRDGITAESWEWRAGQAIFTEMSDAIKTDLEAKDTGGRPSCEGLDPENTRSVGRALDELKPY